MKASCQTQRYLATSAWQVVVAVVAALEMVEGVSAASEQAAELVATRGVLHAREVLVLPMPMRSDRSET